MLWVVIRSYALLKIMSDNIPRFFKNTQTGFSNWKQLLGESGHLLFQIYLSLKNDKERSYLNQLPCIMYNSQLTELYSDTSTVPHVSITHIVFITSPRKS